MKKYLVFCCFWFVALSIGVTCKTQSMQYVIYNDSANENTYNIKNEILQRYADIVQGVHEESVTSLIIHNVDAFAWDDTMQAEWRDQKLQVTIGDGQGSVIHGDLEVPSVCFPEARPKSLFAELFQ